MIPTRVDIGSKTNYDQLAETIAVGCFKNDEFNVR